MAAVTQYSDFKGTIAVDGQNSTVLSELAAKSKMPAGYRPVGLEIYAAEPRIKNPQVYILAIDAAVVEEDGGGSIANYAAKHRKIPVFRFPLSIKFAELLKLIKRVNIIVAQKALAKKELNILEDG